MIDLREIPVLWTSCNKPSLIQRNLEMECMLGGLGLKGIRVDGPITEPYLVGLARGHIQMLTRHRVPFLAFEDDARIICGSGFSFVIEPPENADALYLGTSTYGRIRGFSIKDGSICAKYNEIYLRSFNMLGLHSVLYLNSGYVARCVALLEHWLLNPIGGCDDTIAENMHRYNVYCLSRPWFYQNDGHSESATTHLIIPML